MARHSPYTEYLAEAQARAKKWRQDMTAIFNQSHLLDPGPLNAESLMRTRRAISGLIPGLSSKRPYKEPLKRIEIYSGGQWQGLRGARSKVEDIFAYNMPGPSKKSMSDFTYFGRDKFWFTKQGWKDWGVPTLQQLKKAGVKYRVLKAQSHGAEALDIYQSVMPPEFSILPEESGLVGGARKLQLLEEQADKYFRYGGSSHRPRRRASGSELNQYFGRDDRYRWNRHVAKIAEREGLEKEAAKDAAHRRHLYLQRLEDEYYQRNPVRASGYDIRTYHGKDDKYYWNRTVEKMRRKRERDFARTPEGRRRQHLIDLDIRLGNIREDYVSPFEFKAHYPTQKEAIADAEALFPAGGSTSRVVDAYAAALGMERKNAVVKGSRVTFSSGIGNRDIISLPLFGPIYSRRGEKFRGTVVAPGELTGYQGGVQVIRQTGMNQPLQVESGQQAVLDDIAKAGKDYGELRRRVAETQEFLRYNKIRDSQLGTNMGMMHLNQFKWKHDIDPRTGRQTYIPSHALSKDAQLIKGTYGHKYVGFRFGKNQIYGVRHVGAEEVLDPITNLSDLRTLMPDLLGYVKKSVGATMRTRDGTIPIDLSRLNWDPTRSAAPLSGSFLLGSEASIDPFGYIQKRGYQFGQQFTTVSLNVERMAGRHGGLAGFAQELGVSKETLTAGRLLRTFMERESSARGAVMSSSYKLAAHSPDIVGGLNVAGGLLFGEHSMMLPEHESVLISSKLKRAMRAGMGIGLGTGTPVFTMGGIGKGNVIGVRSAEEMARMAGFEAHVLRAGQFKTPADLVRSMMSGYARAGLDKGLTHAQVIKALKMSIGTDNFAASSDLQAVLDKSFELFAAKGGGANTAGGALNQTFSMLKAFGQLLGVSHTSFMHFDKNNKLVGMRTLENFGVRTQHLNRLRAHINQGLNIGSGQRVAANYASIFRGLGSESLAELFTELRRNPELTGAIDFRRNVFSTIGHLIPGYEPLKAPTAPSLTLKDLAAGVKRSEVKEFLQRFDAKEGYEGIAAALRESTFIKGSGLENLFRGKGFHLQLGEAISVGGKLSGLGATMEYGGTVSELAIPNISHTNLKDRITGHVLRMVSAGEANVYDVAPLTQELLRQYLGGKKSLIAELASPKIGSEFLSTIQKSATLNATEYQDLVNQALDNMVKMGQMSPEVRAGIDLSKERFVFKSAHTARELSKAHQKILGKRGYLKAILTRDPVTGRGMAANVLFIDDRTLPQRLQGLLRSGAMVSGIGDVNYLIGDTDYDTVRAMIAERVEGDKFTQMMEAGFYEMQDFQETALRYLDAEVPQRIAEQRKASRLLAEQAGAVLEGAAVPEELRKMYEKILAPGAREESMLGTTALKALTGLSYGPALERSVVHEALTRTGADPFGGSKVLRGYYTQEFLPGIQQLYISKHKTAGKESLETLKRMNTAIGEYADAKIAGEAGKIKTAQANAANALKDLMKEVHPSFHEESIMPFAGGHAETLFGIPKKEATAIFQDRERFAKYLESGPGSETVNAIVEAETSMRHYLDWIKNARIGKQYGDIYNEGDFLRHAKTLQSRLGPDSTAVHREIVALLGDHSEAMESMASAAKVADLAAEKVKFGKEIARAMEPGGLKAGLGNDVKTLGRLVYDELATSIKANPKAYGLAGMVAGGMLALGVLNWAGRKADQYTTPAGQESGVPTSPRTEYFVPEESVVGSQLNGRINLPPDSIQGMSGELNRMDPRADIRIMDSRIGLSDRTLGYDAEDIQNSLYARKQI